MADRCVAPDRRHGFAENTSIMLRWAAIFLVIAIIAAVFGFGDLSAGAAGIAKTLFFFFLVLFVGSLVLGYTAFKKK